MLLLDTNIVSALMRPEQNADMIRWADRQIDGDIWTSTVTLYELRYGIARLPAGRRKDELQDRFEASVSIGFGGRVLVFDRSAADAAGRLDASRRARGVIVGTTDTFIAGIAIANRATLVTRNLRHFADAGVPLVDPFGG